MRAAVDYQDEAWQRVALGQVLAHGGRWLELAGTREFFTSSRRRMFDVLARRAEAAQPVDLESEAAVVEEERWWWRSVHPSGGGADGCRRS